MNDSKVNVWKKVLEEGTLIGRYGSPRGEFFSPEGTTYEQRSLALHSDNADYYVYRVVRPLEVDSCKIAPWFGREGGTQFIKYHDDGTKYTINELIDEGYVEEVLKKEERKKGS